MSNDTDFIHIFKPGAPTQPALLLLHGTGGDEHDLIDLASAVAPDSAILSVRGKVLENGMPRFFARKAEGVFDMDDLYARTDELADFVAAARMRYNLHDRPLYALGYSNGANIATSLFLRHPDSLDGGILLRAMQPYQPEQVPALKDKKILQLNGLMDQIIPREQADYLAHLLQQAQATVTYKMKPVGHGLAQSDINDMKDWLSAN